MTVVVPLVVVGIAAFCVAAAVRGRQAGPRASPSRPADSLVPNGRAPLHRPSTAPRSTPRPPNHRRLVPGGTLEVVGESFYQPALLAAVHGRTAEPGEDGIGVEAALVPEPGNPHDENAVRVEVGGQLVGHLPRTVAADYQRALLGVPGGGAWGTCSGRVFGGGDRYYGIWLQVAPPGWAIPINELAGRVTIDGSRRVTVTGEEAHQDELARLVTAGVPASAWVDLVPGIVPRGKYAGEPCIDIQVDGNRLGCLTKTMSDRYSHLVVGGRSTCIALIDHEPRGFQVELLLP